MEASRFKIASYCFTARHHRAVRAAWASLVAIAAWLASGVGWPRLPLASRATAALLAAALAVTWLALLALWPGFSAWYGRRFRYVAWRSAKALAAARRAGPVAASAALLFLLLVAAGLSRPRLPAAAEVAGAALGLVLFGAALRLRRRLVVVPFASFGGGAEDKAFADGLAARLHAELAGTRDLYRLIDEMWTPSSAGGAFALTLNAQDPGSEIQGIVGPDAKLSFGFLQLPLGALFGVLSRLVQGPRISGSVHGSGAERTIVAAVSGGGFRQSWRAERDDREAEGRPQGPQASPAPDDLVEQLAYRILTDLAPVGSPRWRAVRSHARGLTSYRETRRTQRDRPLLLADAERHLLAALEADDQFARCHYNLGVVYREMGRPDSAEMAFRNALQKGHSFAECRLALASLRFESGRWGEAIRLCDGALEIEPDQPKTWSLRGLALRKEREQEVGEQGFGAGDERWLAIEQSREVALALAWRQLCAATLAGRPASELTDVARIAAVNLAVVKAQRHRHAAAERTLFQAIHLAPGDQSLRHELGKIRFDRGDLAGTVDAFRTSFAATLDPVRRADQLLRTLVSHEALAGQPRRKEARRAADRAAADADSLQLLDLLVEMDVVDRLDRLLLPRHLSGPSAARLRAVAALHRAAMQGENEATDGYRERLGRLHGRLAELLRRPAEAMVDEAYLDRLAAFGASLAEAEIAADFRAADLGAVTAWLTGGPDETAEERSARRAALARTVAEDRAWIATQSDILLAGALQKEPTGIDDPPASEDLLEGAIARLADRGSEQPRSQHLEGQIVYACIARLPEQASVEREALLGKALLHAERAVRLDPESADDHRLLGWVHLLYGHFERSEAELSLSQSLAPGDPQMMQSIAQSYWNLGVERRDHASRRAAFERVIDLLGQSLRLDEAFGFAPERLPFRGWTHHWLGRFHNELRHFDEGRSSLQIALRLGFKRLGSRLALAGAAVDERTYGVARTWYREALVELRRQRSDVRRAAGAAAVDWEAQAADPPDTDLTLNAALVEIELGRAELDIESGCSLDRAERLLRWAKRRLPRVKASGRSEYRALHDQLQGEILLRRGHPAAALRSLRQALQTSDRASVYRAIARCHLALARAGEAEPEPSWAAAREACLRARAADLRELEGERIDALLAEIERERAASEAPREAKKDGAERAS